MRVFGILIILFLTGLAFGLNTVENKSEDFDVGIQCSVLPDTPIQAVESFAVVTSSATVALIFDEKATHETLKPAKRDYAKTSHRGRPTIRML